MDRDNEIGLMPMLDLSTAHMPEEDPDFGEVRTAPHEYGYVVWVTDPDPQTKDKIPSWLYPIIEAAYRSECVLINFDRDADTVEAFQKHDW